MSTWVRLVTFLLARAFGAKSLEAVAPWLEDSGHAAEGYVVMLTYQVIGILALDVLLGERVATTVAIELPPIPRLIDGTWTLVME